MLGEGLPNRAHLGWRHLAPQPTNGQVGAKGFTFRREAHRLHSQLDLLLYLVERFISRL
jgi:hypothetical protein